MGSAPEIFSLTTAGASASAGQHDPCDLNKAASPSADSRYRHKVQHAQRKGLKVPISTLCTGDEGKRTGSIMSRQRPCKGRVGMKKGGFGGPGATKDGREW